MADPLSASVTILTLVTFGAQSVGSLLAAIQDFRKYPSVIAQLKDELLGLQKILESLEAAIQDGSYDFSALKLPVNQCGDACKEFEDVINSCTAHSSENRRSFRDWARLKYKGDDISNFKSMLAAYKDTIAIALCDANLRTTKVTLDALNQYKDMIQTTTCDLEFRFQEIDDKLRRLLKEDGEATNHRTPDLQQIEEEKRSLTQCLDICAQVSSNIDDLRPTLLENITTPPGGYLGLTSPGRTNESYRLATAFTLQNCNDQIQTASMWLRNYLTDVDKQLSQPGKALPQDNRGAQETEKERFQKEIETLQKSLAVCEQAAKQANEQRRNVFEDVHMAEEGRQVMVSTVGDLIFARNVSAGARSLQLLGQMSDMSLQTFAGGEKQQS